MKHRSPPLPHVLPWLLLLVPLAGCTAPAETQHLPHLSWSQTMDVETTAVEPFEFQGFLRIAWKDGLVAIDSEVEPDLPRFLVRDGDTVYTSRQGIGWTRWSLEEAVDAGRLSNRLVLWDLKGLLEDPRVEVSVQEGPGQRLLLDGTLSHAGRPLRVNATIDVADGHIVTAHVASPEGRESPFRLVPSAAPLSFPLRVPEESRTRTETDALDAEARQAHVQVIRLIQDHQERRAGQLPERIDAASLRVEMALAGHPWPENPYTGSALAQGEESGDIRWKRCTPTSGIYMGLGWDLSVVGESFGGSCTF